MSRLHMKKLTFERANFCGLFPTHKTIRIERATRFSSVDRLRSKARWRSKLLINMIKTAA